MIAGQERAWTRAKRLKAGKWPSARWREPSSNTTEYQAVERRTERPSAGHGAAPEELIVWAEPSGRSHMGWVEWDEQSGLSQVAEPKALGRAGLLQ